LLTNSVLDVILSGPCTQLLSFLLDSMIRVRQVACVKAIVITTQRFERGYGVFDFSMMDLGKSQNQESYWVLP